MNNMFYVKGEYMEPFSSSFQFGYECQPLIPPPQPIEGLHEIRPQPFLTKTFDVVSDQSTNHVVSWSRGGASFVIWDPQAFFNYLLPRYFKHNNFSSFVRQLNTYGFRKIDPHKWEFANGGFLRGHKHLLRNIRRKKGPSRPIDCFGLDAEIDRLRQEKQVLTKELVSLRQKQYKATLYLLEMEQRLQGVEVYQKQMMSFLDRAVKNPAIIHQLLQQKEKKKETMAKKRRLIGGEERRSSVKVEPLELGDNEFSVSELELLAKEMQVFGRGREINKDNKPEALELQERMEGALDDEGFWEELMLNVAFEGRFDIPAAEDNDENEDDSCELLNQEFKINSFPPSH
ncbi:heat stress transcription factor A-7a-like [Vicia villosa]|uniref:heat stress transcription factor A-7a-like n=1 Tax=Vicia villosa TaxID=3911 RepID=UPI00273BD217|nr:heat stress transcription factor A-7a-like [Vicia villosa]